MQTAWCDAWRRVGRLIAGVLMGVGVLMGAGQVASSAPPTTQGDFPRTIGSVERIDPALDALIPKDASIEVLADGFDWSEGPLWLPSERCVVFSDVPANRVYRWDDRGGLAVFLEPSGYTGRAARAGEKGSNGLALDRQGRLLLCQHGDRCVARMEASLREPKPQFEVLAGSYANKPFNSPNDLVVHSRGAVFFTDPPYGMINHEDKPGETLNFNGVYRVDPDGEVTSLVRDLPRPNGIALSPDEKTLYVAQSHAPAKIYMAYELDEKLEVLRSRVLLDATDLGRSRRGNPDGLKLDIHGNLFATGPGGVLVITPQGKHLGTIMTGELTSNCAFGDDGGTLYMTCDRYLCRIRLSTRGFGF